MGNTRKIEGRNISCFRTLGSKFDDGDTLNVIFELNGERVLGRIKTETLIKLVDDFAFDVVKKRVYYHLENPSPLGYHDTGERR